MFGKRRGWAFLGGSFDPVHNGHITLATMVHQRIPVQKVWLMPAGQPWQKKIQTNAFDRQTMLRYALQYHSSLGYDDREILRSGPTYTVDTVRQLRMQVGPYFPLVWIIGWDQWCNLSTWKDWQSLVEYVHLLIVPRGRNGQKVSQDVQEWAQSFYCMRKRELVLQPFGCIFQMPEFSHSASSSKIRRIFATHTPRQAAKVLESWLPQSVLCYILQHHLY